MPIYTHPYDDGPEPTESDYDHFIEAMETGQFETDWRQRERAAKAMLASGMLTLMCGTLESRSPTIYEEDVPLFVGAPPTSYEEGYQCPQG